MESQKNPKCHDDDKMGNARKRGILMEAISAITLLLAGGDVMIMRHPEAIKLVRNYINTLTEIKSASQP